MDKVKTGRKKFAVWTLGLAVMVLLACAGWWAADSRATVAEIEMRRQFLRQASLIAKNVSPEAVRQLTFTSADKETPVFERLREQLTQCGRAVPNVRWIYCMAKRENRVVFAMDIGFGVGKETEPPAEPGEVYADTSDSFLRDFDSMQPFTDGPCTDKWGTFVSALAPVLDPRTGEVLVMIGLDIDAGDWQAQVNAARRTPIFVTLAAICVLSGVVVLLDRRNRHSTPDALRLKPWIVTPTALAALAVLTLFGTYEYEKTTGESGREMVRLADRTQRRWNRETDAQVGVLKEKTAQIARDPEIIRAWRRADRAKLAALTQPIIERLQSEHDITHLDFITPERICFLRAQAPTRHDDRLERSTLLAAERTGDDCWGLDVGSFGELALFYVKPCRQDGRVIGYLELATDCRRLVARLAKGMEFDIVFATRKQYTTCEQFDVGRRIYGPAGQWDAYSNLVVGHQTTPLLPDQAMSWIDAHRDRAAAMRTFYARQGTSHIACGLVHLFDTAGRDVADILAMQDVTVQAAVAQNKLLMSLGAATLLLGGILVLLWSVTGIAEKQLSSAFAGMRASQASYEQVVAMISDIVWRYEVDGEGRFVGGYISPVADRLLGLPAGAIGNSFEKFLAYVSPDDLATIQALLLSGLRGLAKDASAEFRMRKADGTTLWMRARGSAYLQPNGNIVGFGVTSDITDSKRAEETLRLTQFATDRASDGVVWVDKGGRLLYVNEAVCRCLGYRQDELLQMSVLDIDRGYSAEEWLPHWEELRKKGHMLVERRYLAKDGTIVPVEVSLDYLEYQGEGYDFAFIRDITERKRTEEALWQSRKTLEQYAASLEASNHSLTELNKLAETGMRTKTEFLANMSHEIRTPIAAILGYADLMLGENVSRATEEYVAIIKRNGEHLLGIINDILDLSKIEAGKMRIETTRCSPWEILAEVVSLMRVRADAKHLKLELEQIGPLPETVLTDPLRLRQILVNLVANAVKFTDRGEVQIRARLACCDGAARLCIEVSDTGIGMDEEEVSRLFVAFTQVDNSAARKFGGSGMGLCISKRLAEALGGAIDVRSTPGRGSVFCVTIDPGPLDGVAMVDEQPSQTILPKRAAVNAADPIRLCGRILMAEDGQDNQRLIALLLRKAGIEVTAVNNGRLATEAALAASEGGQPFDVILMDMQMPVMDGYEATRQLRTAGYAGPIVALTAHAMSGDCQKCLEAGCSDYATKPIDRQKLLATVAHWMAQKSPADATAIL